MNLLQMLLNQAVRLYLTKLVFYLPSYSLELNLDKRLNADLKYVLGSWAQVRTKGKLRKATKDRT